MFWTWAFVLVQCLILSVDSLDGSAKDTLPGELSRLSGNDKDGFRGKRESQVIERIEPKVSLCQPLPTNCCHPTKIFGANCPKTLLENYFW